MKPFSKLTTYERGRKEQWYFCTPWVVTRLEQLHLRGVRKGHFHVDLPGWGEKHMVVMELVTEEASRQQAVNHSPSALEATWFGNLRTRVSCLLIVSALNNCLLISQSLVLRVRLPQEHFHFLPGPYLLQAIHLSLGALCCHLVNCLLFKVFHV